MALRSLFLENHNQSYQQYKDDQRKESEQEVIHRSLEVEDHVSHKDELVVPRSVIERSFSV
jgi:hypothetical protein